jgi:transposase
MLHLSPAVPYFLYAQPADMRKGFDSLSGIVSSQMQRKVLDGSVFIFLNRARTHIKLLQWDGDGFALFYKRLERGTYELPAFDHQTISATLSYQQLQFMLQGVSLKKIEYRKRYQRN